MKPTPRALIALAVLIAAQVLVALPAAGQTPPGQAPPPGQTPRPKAPPIQPPAGRSRPAASRSPGLGPVTTAESTNYKATSTYAEVLAFIRDLQKLSPLVRVETIATSTEGRAIPLLVIGKPRPRTRWPCATTSASSSTSRPISTPARSRARKRR